VTSTTLGGAGFWDDDAAGSSARAEREETTAPLSASTTLAAAASVAAGVVHAAAAGSHNGERTLALLFAFTAVAQLAAGGLAIVRRDQVALVAAVGVNAAALGAWAFTRTTGTDLVAGLEERQDIALADGAAAALQAIAVIAGFVAFATLRRARSIPTGWAAVVGVVALLGAVPAMAAPHDHTTHTDDHQASATEVAAGADGHGHGHDGAATAAAGGAGDPNLVLGVKLPQVDGVTQEQKVKAATLINKTRAALVKFSDTAAAEAAGFFSIGDGRTGFEHFVNRAYLVNQNVLDPNEPESLVFKVNPDGTKTLASAMYILPPGKTMADVPDIAGPMTEWHDHQNLCWDDTGVRLAGILVNGQCRPGGTFRPTPPMLHVWVTEHPCGPFAGIEGGGHPGACHHTH
jgi:hypothetical protein